MAPTGEGVHALKVSFAALMLTAVIQSVVVAISGSVALLADTVHNLSDALTAVPLGFAFWLARRPANARYPYGYGRAEDLAGVFIVAMIAVSAAVAVWESVRRLLDPSDISNVGWVIAASIVGFAGNELVASYRIRVGRRIGSAALVADGHHARTDGLTSLAVLFGAVGVALGFPLADPIVGLLIAVAILFVLKSAARDIYRRLMDSVDPPLVAEVEHVLTATPGVRAVESVRLRWIGHRLFADAGISCDAGCSLAEAHAVAIDAHHRLLHDIPHLAEAAIHVSPAGEEGHQHHAVLDHHRVAR
ncbi:MAG: cation diffusion facilitator family transporter [Nitriliruptorales bacterium]|nr:cation diffusion facilitator family transporter [Nitriliruptorales bacterium]